MKKKRVFFNILLSYIIIMLVPILILSYTIFNYFYGYYEKELIENRIDSVRKMQSTIDIFINEMNSNAYILLNSYEMSTSHLQAGYGNFYDVVSKLRNISFTNDFIDNVFYLNDDMKVIFTDETMYEYADFKTFSSGYTEVESDNTVAVLSSIQRMYWLPVQSARQASAQVLTYVVTNNTASNPSRMSVFFQIKAGTLGKLAGSFMDDPDSCVVIADAMGNLLYSTNDTISDTVWKERAARPGVAVNESMDFKAGEERFISFISPSHVTPIQFATFINYESILQPLENLKIIFFVCLLIITAVGMVFIASFMKVNYAPIHSLSKLAHSFFKAPQGSMNEFEATEKALMLIAEHNSNFMRDKITLKLIRGGYKSLGELKAEGDKADYPLSGPKFRVVVFDLTARHNRQCPLDTYQEIARIIEKHLHRFGSVCAVEYSEDKSLIAILSGADEQLIHLRPNLQELKDAVEVDFDLQISIGVGNVFCIEKIPESYTQASTANQYQLLQGSGGIKFYDIMVNESIIQYNYPNRAIDALYHAIKQGQEERIHFAVDALVREISRTNSLFFGTCLAYDIVNTALKAMRELNYTFYSLKENFPEIINQGPLKSTAEIVEVVNRLTQEILFLLANERFKTDGEPVVRSFDQVMRYLDEHLCEESFSIKLLAANFGMSVSNFSHYFKKQTGRNVSDYIALMKTEKAKELLRTTDMNLEDISTMCGYLHISTFMRQFKLRENMTPSKYRGGYRS